MSFYTTFIYSLFALRWVNGFTATAGGRRYNHTLPCAGVEMSQSLKLKGKSLSAGRPQADINVRHKHNGTFPQHTKLHSTRKVCEAKKC